MRHSLFGRYLPCIFAAGVVVLSGCASSPLSRFYQLNPVSGGTPVTQNAAHDGSVTVIVGPLRIPDYLDRPQILTRSAKNELNLAEFDRWAGSLEDDILRVFAEDMSTLLPAKRFFVIRWTPFLGNQLTASYNVEVSVERFEGTLDGEVSLRAQWALYAGEGKRLLLMRDSSINVQAQGNDYASLVDAMSRAIAKLSEEVASVIAAL